MTTILPIDTMLKDIKDEKRGKKKIELGSILEAKVDVVEEKARVGRNIRLMAEVI